MLFSLFAGVVALYPLTFGIGFPYSMAVAQILFALVFLFSARDLIERYAELLLVASLFLLMFALFHGVVRYWPGLGHAKVDALKYAHALAQSLVAGMVFFTAAWSGGSDRGRRWLVGAVVAACAGLIVTGIIAPRDSTSVLGFYPVPTVDRFWQSPLVDDWLTSMHGEYRRVMVADIPVYQMEKNVSSRPIGPIFDENQYAAVLGITIPFVFGFAVQGWQRRFGLVGRIGLTTAIAAIVIGFAALTGSRGGAAALAVAMLAFPFLLLKKIRPLLLLSGSLVLAAALSIGVAAVSSAVLQDLLAGRWVIWHKTLAVFLQAPWLGIGLGNFADQRLIVDERLLDTAFAAHNVYLQGLVSLGLAGFVLIALAGVAAWRVTRARWRLAMSPPVAGAWCALLFAAWHGAIDYSPTMPFSMAMLMVTAGFLFGAGWSGPSGRPVSGKLSLVTVRAAALIAVCVVTLTALSALYVELVSADYRRTLALSLSEKYRSPAVETDLANGLESLAARRLPIFLSRDLNLRLAQGYVVLSGALPDATELALYYLGRYQRGGVYDIFVGETQRALEARLIKPG